MSIEFSGMQVRTEAATSPSGMAKTLTPRSYILWMASSWRGFARVTTVRSRTGFPREVATAMMFFSSERLRSITPFAPLPTIIFSIYMSGAFRNPPLSAAASTATAFAWPMAVILVPSIGSTAMSTEPTFSPM